MRGQFPAAKLAELRSRIYTNVVSCAAHQPKLEQRRAMVEQWERAWGAEKGERFRQDVAAFYQRREAA